MTQRLNVSENGFFFKNSFHFDKILTKRRKKKHQNYPPAYRLPKIYYGEQIILGLEGPFLQDTNDSVHQVTVKLMSGSRPIDVNLRKLQSN